MPIRFKVKAKCTAAGKVNGYGGQQIHGALFSFLRDFDLDLASKIHHSESKPFSIGRLEGEGKRIDGMFCCLPSQEYSFTVSFLDDSLKEPVITVLNEWANTSFSLGSAEMQGQGLVEGTTERSYPELLWTSALKRRIELHFISPTSFRQLGKQLLFPDPDRVFQSIHTTWNNHSGIKLPDFDYRQLMVQKYSLRTEMVPFSKYKVIGFLGRCTYLVPKSLPREMVRQINSLAAYSMFSGVGYKTTMGLGNVWPNLGSDHNCG